MRTKNIVLVPAMLLLFCAYASCVYGGMNGWTGGAGTQDWYDAGNWSLGRIPADGTGFDDWVYIVNGRVFVEFDDLLAAATTLDIGHFFMGGSGTAVVNLMAGTMNISGGISLGDETNASGMLNVVGGTLLSADIGQQGGTTNGQGILNVIGSDSMIMIDNFSYVNHLGAFRELDSNFYLDVDGVSPIVVTSNAGLDGDHLISARGFSLQAPGQTYYLFALIGDADFGGTFETDSPLTITTTSSSVTAVFDEPLLEVWDIATSIAFSGDEQLDGWLKIERGADAPESIHGNLTGVTDEIAPLLQDFLLSGMPDGTSLMLLSDPDGYHVTVSTDTFINGDYFGWGMSGFNAIYGTDVRLTGFDVPIETPEPSAVILFGLGAIALFCRRKRGQR